MDGYSITGIERECRLWLQISDDQGALVFGGTDIGSSCHDVPITSSVNFDVILMMVNSDVDFEDNTRVYLG